jgi:hypothetical protein
MKWYEIDKVPLGFVKKGGGPYVKMCFTGQACFTRRNLKEQVFNIFYHVFQQLLSHEKWSLESVKWVLQIYPAKRKVVFCFFVFFFFWSNWSLNSRLSVKQVLYCLSHISSPFFALVILKMGSQELFAQAGLALNVSPPDLSLLSS